jgi:hypothetical protein
VIFWVKIAIFFGTSFSWPDGTVSAISIIKVYLGFNLVAEAEI